MNCPDIERIIRFSSRLPAEADAELAAHVHGCSECQRNLRMALDVTRCSWEPSKWDLIEARNIVSAALNDQDPLKEIIEWFAAKLDSCSLLMLGQEKIPYLTASKDQVFAGAQIISVPRAKGPEICFSSAISRISPYYWEAVLHFPLMLANAGSLEFYISDCDDKPLSGGVLRFRGIDVAIKDGKGVISVEDFKRSMQGEGVCMIFSDGYVSHGGIKLK